MKERCQAHLLPSPSPRLACEMAKGGELPLCVFRQVFSVGVWKDDRVEITLTDTMTSSVCEVWKFFSSWITFAPFLSFVFLSCLSLFPILCSCQMQGENRCDDPRRDAILHMQTPVSMETTMPSPWRGRVEVRSGLCALSQHNNPNPTTRSLRRPGPRHSHSPPPPFRSCSIPIIPSVQCHHDNEVSCMQTSVTPAATVMSVTCGVTPCRDERRERAGHTALSSSFYSTAIGQQQDEVALLLKEAQEQLRALALAHRKQENSGISSSGSTAALVEVKETVCFLNPNGGSAGVLSCNGPMQTQLLSSSLSHRDLGQNGQWKDTI